MSEIIPNKDFLELMEEAFSNGTTICFTPSGSSMLPLLDGRRDTVTLKKKPAQLRKYDVIFYVRKSGAFVLHRIVRCEKDGTYTLSGDNQYYLEKGVRYEDVKAVMAAYTKDGEEKSLSALSYRAYSRYNVLKKYIRMALVRVYRSLFHQ